MRKAWRIFVDDFAQLRGNIIAIVIMCGLVILPSLYVWFSLLAFWNPEGNTGNLSVAVANEDVGYQSDLIPTRVDAGSQVVSELRADPKFDWTFTTEDDAIEGVKSGAYYAAVIIPEDFSKNLVSVFSGNVVNPSIDYYVNEKTNPIAPHLTSIGASTLQEDIDQTFTSTVTDVALGTNSNLAQFMEGKGLVNYANILLDSLGEASGELSGDASQVRAFSALMGQTLSLVQASTQALDATGDVTGKIEPLVQSTREGLDKTSQATSSLVALAGEALDAARGALQRIGADANEAFDTLKGDPEALSHDIGTLREGLATVRDAYAGVRDDIAAIDPGSPLLGTIDEVTERLDRVDASLGEVSSEISGDAASIETARGELAATLDEAVSALDGIQSSYGAELEGHANSLRANLDALGGDLVSMASKLGEATGELADSSTPLVTSMADIRTALDATAQLLDDSAAQIDQSREDLSQALANNDLAEVRRIVGDDPSGLAKTLSAPTGIAKHAVYGVADYGSAMSPFYTSLGLFIAAIFLVIILKSQLTPARRHALGRVTDTQEYVGHGAFLLVIALAQALLMCTGNLFFLGVQCDSIPLYYLTGLTTEFVFFTLIYALVVSFGDVGKALAVILLVLQVAGSGGELPIQLSGQIFQDIYPWLPFTHSMSLFQGAIAGIYGNQYLVSYLCLLAFTVPALILGLVLRKPIKRLNDFVNAQLEKTGVM